MFRTMRTLGEIVAYLAKEGGLGAATNGAAEQHKTNGAAAYSTSSNGAVEGAPRPLAEGPGFTTLGRFAARAIVSPALGLGTRGILDSCNLFLGDAIGKRSSR